MNRHPHRSIGTPLDRVDGPLKVTGGARYAAEYGAEGLLHGAVVNSRIARGRIIAIDSDAACAVPGVRLVMSHLNRPPLAADDESYEDEDSADGSSFRPLFNDRVLYNGQPVALVVADDLQTARYAAALVTVEYAPEPHATDLRRQLDDALSAPAELPGPRGDADGALASAPVRIEAEYELPVEHHNPMEPHASTVIYQADGSLLVHDKTQGSQNSQSYLCHVLKLEPTQVRVQAAFVGGAFGSGLRPQYQLPLAAMAALMLKRSVRVALTRQQQFTFGYRPRTVQRLSLGADAEGRRTYDADGATRVDQAEEIGLRIPPGPYETLAGVVARELGRIPAVGDTVDTAGWRLTVSRASGHRAARLRLLSPPPGARADGDGPDSHDGEDGR